MTWQLAPHGSNKIPRYPRCHLRTGHWTGDMLHCHVRQLAVEFALQTWQYLGCDFEYTLGTPRRGTDTQDI